MNAAIENPNSLVNIDELTIDKQQMRVLVVDDSRAIRKALTSQLVNVGLNVEEASSGKEALNVIYRDPPDLVLLDVVMPGMDGMSVLKILRGSYSKLQLPIVLVTSCDSSTEIVQALDAGASDYLTKPIDFDILWARISNQLMQKKAAEYLSTAQQKLELEVKQRTAELDKSNQSLKKEIQERLQAEDKIRMLGQAVHQSPLSIVIIDPDKRIEYVNPKTCEISQYHSGELIGIGYDIFRSENHRSDDFQDIWSVLDHHGDWNGELLTRRKNGSEYWEQASVSVIKDHKGEITHYLMLKEDVTQKKAYEDELYQQANYDELTGLPNRTLAMDRLDHALQMAKRHELRPCIVFVDLDNFKYINDTLGHAAGDKLLCEASERLSSSARESDTVARLGGDEFLLILEDVDTSQPAEMAPQAVAERILEAFSPDFILEGRNVHVTPSIGMAVYGKDGVDADTLMRHADTAMYRSKTEGRNTFCFYSPEMTVKAKLRVEIESHLRNALENNELSLCFQPIVQANSGRMVKAEALLRWTNAELGMITPDKFIPIAEETGLIIPIGRWVLDAACKQVKQWRDHGWPHMRVAVNVSAVQFRADTDLLAVVKEVLDKYKLPAEALEFEITEGVLMKKTEQALATMQELKTLGVHLSIDDFGTGYSSISYLQRYPFDSLKIDRSYINNVLEKEQDARLVKAIIAMAQSLGMSVVSEGVETNEQLDFLLSVNCCYAQGYYFSKPVKAEEFVPVLDQLADRSVEALETPHLTGVYPIVDAAHAASCR